MNEPSGNPKPKINLPIEWQEERQFEVVVRLRQNTEPRPLVTPHMLARSDTTPPFRPA
jgi:hypothetical protein